jgi:hypothetical protein
VEKFAKHNGLKVFKTSAKWNKGIKEVFEAITYNIIETIDKSSLYTRTESVKLGYINNDYFQNNNNIIKKTENQGNEQCCKLG